MHIVLSQTSPTPLYEQIEDQIRDAIYSGSLRAGDSLPSLRELARDLQVSLITTTRAYNDLAAEGIIGTRQGKGTVVLPVDPVRLHQRVQTQLRQGLKIAIDAALLGDMGIDELREELAGMWRSRMGEKGQ